MKTICTPRVKEICIWINNLAQWHCKKPAALPQEADTWRIGSSVLCNRKERCLYLKSGDIFPIAEKRNKRDGSQNPRRGNLLTGKGVAEIVPRAKTHRREKGRRLYERMARVPRWARKRERQRINARGSIYRWRWTICAGTLLGLSTCAQAGVDTVGSGVIKPGGPPVALATLSSPQDIYTDRIARVGVEFGSNTSGWQDQLTVDGVTYYGNLVVPGVLVYVSSFHGYTTGMRASGYKEKMELYTDKYGKDLTRLITSIGPYKPAMYAFPLLSPVQEEAARNAMTGTLMAIAAEGASPVDLMAYIRAYSGGYMASASFHLRVVKEPPACTLLLNDTVVDLGDSARNSASRTSLSHLQITCSSLGDAPAGSVSVATTIQPGAGTQTTSDGHYLLFDGSKGKLGVAGRVGAVPDCTSAAGNVTFHASTPIVQRPITTAGQIMNDPVYWKECDLNGGRAEPGDYTAHAVVSMVLN